MGGPVANVSGWRLVTYEIRIGNEWVRQQHLTGCMASTHRPDMFAGPGYRNVRWRALDLDDPVDAAIVRESRS